MTTDAAGPGSQRGPDTGSIPATPFSASTIVVRGRAVERDVAAQRTRRHRPSVRAHLDVDRRDRHERYVEASDTALRRSSSAGAPGHDEGIVDLRTTVGNGLAPGTEIAKTAGIVVVGALAVPRPDEHDAKARTNANAPT